jgi:hypothetical protein
MIATLGEVRPVNVGFVGVTTFIFIEGVPTLGNCVGVATLGICVGVATLENCGGVATIVFRISTTDSSLMMCGTCPGIEYG